MKKALALLLAVCLVSFAAGCAGEEDDDTSSGSGTTTSTETE
jgi:hypothetical protein